MHALPDCMSPVNEAAHRREMGSEFHWHGIFPPPLLPWPENSRWYLLARHALASILSALSDHQPKFWLPSYFCGEVSQFCRQCCDLREYRDDPRWPEPDWTTLAPAPHDVVLALNYFGIRDGLAWRDWRERNQCTLLEDHTHDPFSAWSQSSTADYAFASVRKTLPVPDGALLWSPLGLSIPEQPTESDWSGSAMKCAAMFRKAQYLQGHGGADEKEYFRSLQAQGENVMRISRVSSVSPYSYALLCDGVPALWRRQRELNVHCLLARLGDLESAKLLFRNWPHGSVPFAVALIFSSRSERDGCQAHLIQNRVYCPVHWPCTTDQQHALELSSRILSLPVDHRYGQEDMHRLADILLEYPSRMKRAEFAAAIG
jgi:hypothetical protein